VFAHFTAKNVGDFFEILMHIYAMEPGFRVSDFGRVGSRVSVSDPVFDPVLSFNMRIYPGFVSTE